MTATRAGDRPQEPLLGDEIVERLWRYRVVAEIRYQDVVSEYRPQGGRPRSQNHIRCQPRDPRRDNAASSSPSEVAPAPAATATAKVVSRLMWKVAMAPVPDAALGLCSTACYAAASSSRGMTSTI